MILEFIGIAGALLVLASAVGNFTTFSAITQMGSIQERDSPWAQLSRKTAKTVQSVTKTLAKTAASPLDTSHATGKKERELTQSEILNDVRKHDKIVYTLGVVNLALTAYLHGAAPQYFYLWHTPKALLYVAHRWWTFKKQGQHYLLYDFCYWANGLSLLYCWVFPNSPLLFQILFMVSNGPLAWSVLAFSQSLIFHSAPHMTSVFIHVSPMLLTHCIRWNDTPFAVCDGPCEDVSPYQLVSDAVTKFYGWWVVIYYVWVYIVFGNRIKSRGYKTLFDRVISRGPTKFITKVSRNEYVQKAAYMATHFVFAIFTMTLATIYWRSYVAHWVFLVAIVSTSAWNASGFYFTVFTSKYEEELKTRAGVDVK